MGKFYLGFGGGGFSEEELVDEVKDIVAVSVEFLLDLGLVGLDKSEVSGSVLIS